MTAPADGRTVVMVTSSYPRFPGDSIATFMEPIAKSISAGGHDVHIVAPWHPQWQREEIEGDIHFHLFRYAPIPSLNVFGYAAGLHADVRLRVPAVAVAPLALMAGCLEIRRVKRRQHASVIHAHWVIPSGVMGAAVSGRTPLVISLHGSDVFVAERHWLAGRAARAAFQRAAWVTACSDDLRNRAVRLGAPPDRTSVVPYGVDVERFKPDRHARAHGRTLLGIADSVPVVFAFGRLVEKKGFAYLVEAAARLKPRYPALRVVIAGGGDLDPVLRAQALAAGVTESVQLLGVVPQHTIPILLSAADVAVAPSIRDDAGNVDGLPNTVLEIMASQTPLVATRAGGIGTVATDERTARLVPERDAPALAAAIDALLREPSVASEIGREARALVCRNYSWARVGEQFNAIYEHVT